MMMAWLIVVDQWLEAATNISLRRLLGTRRGDGCCMAGKILSGEALVMNTLKERDALLEEQWKRFKKFL